MYCSSRPILKAHLGLLSTIADYSDLKFISIYFETRTVHLGYKSFDIFANVCRFYAKTTSFKFMYEASLTSTLNTSLSVEILGNSVLSSQK